MNRRAWKTVLLRTARALGAFALARRLTRRRLRVLCYHGAALADEAEFRGGLFMTAGAFESRLEFLERHRYPVIGLDEAVTGLESGRWPDCATVLTIDDGWTGTRTVMAPALERRGFPATLYLSTYYVEKGTQVFNVAVDYVLWKSRETELELSEVHDSLEGTVTIGSEAGRARAAEALLGCAERLPGAQDRQALLERLCASAGVDYAAIVSSRVLSYMSVGEARELARYGVDVQLHTHRHRFSDLTREEVRREIDGNRRALEPIAATPLVHFCYPSGEFEPSQIQWLRDSGIRSATTTRTGLNGAGADAMALLRFLDAEHVSELEFEAVMSGFYDLLRRAGLR